MLCTKLEVSGMFRSVKFGAAAVGGGAVGGGHLECRGKPKPSSGSGLTQGAGGHIF